jgi:hypothetical protein
MSVQLCIDAGSWRPRQALSSRLVCRCETRSPHRSKANTTRTQTKTGDGTKWMHAPLRESWRLYHAGMAVNTEAPREQTASCGFDRRLSAGEERRSGNLHRMQAQSCCIR